MKTEPQGTPQSRPIGSILLWATFYFLAFHFFSFVCILCIVIAADPGSFDSLSSILFAAVAAFLCGWFLVLTWRLARSYVSVGLFCAWLLADLYLVTVAVPNFLRARKRSAATRIQEDLRLIDTAIDQYAIQNNGARPSLPPDDLKSPSPESPTRR